MIKPELTDNNTCCKETKTQFFFQIRWNLFVYFSIYRLKTVFFFFFKKPYITCTCCSLNFPNVRGFNLDTGGCISAKVWKFGRSQQELSPPHRWGLGRSCCAWVLPRASGTSRERSGDDGVHRGACRHSIDACGSVIPAPGIKIWLLELMTFDSFHINNLIDRYCTFASLPRPTKMLLRAMHTSRDSSLTSNSRRLWAILCSIFFISLVWNMSESYAWKLWRKSVMFSEFYRLVSVSGREYSRTSLCDHLS